MHGRPHGANLRNRYSNKNLRICGDGRRKPDTLERKDTRLAQPGSLGIGDLKDRVDFVLAFAVVHELPSPAAFFREAAAAMKTGALMLFVEPAGHVKPENFQTELQAAREAGLEVTTKPAIRKSFAAILRKP